LRAMFPTINDNVVVGIWDLAGDLRVSAREDGVPAWVPRPPLVEEAQLTPLEAAADTLIHFGLGAPVRSGRTLVGFLQVRQRTAASADSTAIQAVLGPTGRILLGGVGGVWAEGGTVVPAPPPEIVGAPTAVSYERAGARRLGLGRVLDRGPLVLVAEVSEDTALAGTRDFLRDLGLFATLLVVLTTGAAWALGQRITRPLKRLRSAAEALGREDYTQRVPETGHAELVEVARSFNKMAAATEQQVAAVRASEQRLRTLVTATAQIVWWTDPDGMVAEPMPSWQSFTGQTFEETRGTGWANALHHDDAGNTLAVWREAVRSRSLFEAEFRLRRHDGEYRWFVMRAVPVLVNGGRIREWVATCTDVTQRRDAEERLKGKELELQRAQRLDAVGRLAGGIAHDFNNLLAAILVPAELAMAELPEGHRVREDLRDIQKAAHRAADLTRKLLAFGRQQVLNPVVLNANEVIESGSRILERVIGEAVRLELALNARYPTIKVDRTQLEQVVVNLAVNARDAMPDGGRLTIETADVHVERDPVQEQRGMKPGRYVLIAVTDTGVGMDAETQKRIFEPFFTTKEQEKGTGLGLSTVYGIVGQSGGHVHVYSEPGRGTTFKIFFPWVDADVTERAAAPVPAQATPGGTETILVADDEEAIRRVAERILAGLGYTVLTAENGMRALDVAAAHAGRIDLLVSDVVMPEMNGIELWERLRVERPGTPALFLSGWASDAVVRHGILDGQVPFLPKPFSTQQLGAKVREVLDAAGGGPSSG
ncbi:MAG TPA: ATP-binding protein, partial [Longimicrobiales bacterium]|nr:ATP-binding protein [Longimicrobiales bacterium]